MCKFCIDAFNFTVLVRIPVIAALFQDINGIRLNGILLDRLMSSVAKGSWLWRLGFEVEEGLDMMLR